MRLRWQAVTLALAIGPLPARAAERPAVVAVFEIRDRAEKLSKSELTQLTRYLSARLAESGRIQLVPESELRRALDDKQKESYQSCYDEACQIELGRELAAQKSLVTEVVALGSGCALTATLYDLAKAATEQGANERGACTVDAMARMVERIAARLSGQALPEADPPPLATRPESSKPQVETIAAPAGQRAAEVAPPRPGVAISASYLHFHTLEPKLGFEVQLVAPDGRVHRCAGAVRTNESCLLNGVAIGEGRLLIQSESLRGYEHSIEIEPRNHTKDFTLEEEPSDLAVVLWSLGGVALAAGISLVAVGAPTDNSGLVYGGVPAMIAGGGMIIGGFFPAGRVAADDRVLER